VRSSLRQSAPAAGKYIGRGESAPAVTGALSRRNALAHGRRPIGRLVELEGLDVVERPVVDRDLVEATDPGVVVRTEAVVAADRDADAVARERSRVVARPDQRAIDVQLLLARLVRPGDHVPSAVADVQ